MQDFWFKLGTDHKFQGFYHLMSIQGATRMTQLPHPRRAGSVLQEQWHCLALLLANCEIDNKDLTHNTDFSFYFFEVLAQITFNFEITFPFITFVSSSPFSNTHTLTFQSCKTLNKHFSTWLYVPSSLHSGINTCWNSLRACSWVYFLSATHLETSREREKMSQLGDAIWRNDRWSPLLGNLYYENDNSETHAKRIRILVSENVQSTCTIFREENQCRTIISGQ